MFSRFKKLHNNFLISSLVVVVLLIGFSPFLAKIENHSSQTNTQIEAKPLSGEVRGNKQNITVIFGEKSVSLPIPPDTPFYEILAQTQNASVLSLGGKYYPVLGFLITDIGELHAGGGKNLIYYINGKEAQVGVSSYKPQNGDVVEWKLK